MKNRQYTVATISLLTAMIFLTTNASAQDFKAIPSQAIADNSRSIGLNIGDQLPDFIIPKVFSKGHIEQLRSSDFKEQLLLIDFWATTCHGCVDALPEMEKLQQTIGNKLMVLPVTFENATEIAKFWKTNPRTKNLSLPTVVEDKMFSDLFRHKALPHEVWVYKGKVIGITGPEYVNLSTIKKLLSGETMNWPVKNDFYVSNPNTPVFEADSAQIDTRSTIVEYSAACGYKEGVTSIGFGRHGIIRDTAKNIARTYFVNSPIYTAFEICFNDELYRNPDFANKLTKPTLSITPNQVEWEVANRNLYQYQDVAKSGYYAQEWLRFHGICFESVHPNALQNDTQVYARAIKDLNLIFGLNVRWEKRQEEVYVLKRSPSNVRPKLLADGFSSDNLIAGLNQKEDNPYVFDESKMHVILPAAVATMESFDEINKTIAPYGLVLQKESRMVDKLIFAEADASLLPDMDLVNEYNKRKANEKSLKPIGPTDNKDFFVRNKTNRDVITLPSGLQYKIIKQGTGARPLATDNVRVNYTGMLVNGKIFSSSLSTGVPTNWHLSNDIPPGIKEALQLMPVGSKYEVYIPADLGFRDQYFAAMIPKDSGLIYEIELVGIIK